MLLKLDTVPQLEIASKKSNHLDAASLNLPITVWAGMLRRDSPLAHERLHEENVFQWRWPGFCRSSYLVCHHRDLAQKIVGCMEDQYPRVYQVSLSVLAVINFTNQTHPAQSPAMSSFTVACLMSGFMNNICIIKIFFQPELERAGCFPLLFPCIDSDWLSSLLFCLFDSFHPFCWNHHFGIQSDEMCTLLPKRIAYTYKWSYGILDQKNLFSVGCQLFALKFIQRTDHFRPCKHPVAWGIVFLSNLLCLHHSVQLFMHLGMAKGREHICNFITFPTAWKK